MFSSAEKTNRTSATVQQKGQQQSLFRKAGEESFFGGKEQPSFFNAPIQAKLSISSPDDPQEKEADAVADTVMRMPDPTTAAISSGGEEKLDKKGEEEISLQIETPVISRKISCKEEGEEIQAKQLTSIYRMPGEDDASFSDASSAGASTSANINCKQTGLYHSDIIQRSGRGPPASSIPFEQSLSSSKGAGSALPGDTRQFMESRFNADFSGVRIHTGATAQSMSSNIHAQAFAHGNDIYFNEGKFSPQTESGGTLLAHELTHTIQQGASPAKGTTALAPKSIARKNIIQRSGGGVPVQLTNAVEKAKTVEGKIDANKPQADGFRTGWEHLVEIFKSVFGDDMVVSGAGGKSVKGAVAEQDIKKQRTQDGVMVVDTTTKTPKGGIMPTKTGSRDAMPSWCGIFTFWALNKSGVPMPKWKLGERMIKPEAARLPGSPPMPGDIAYRNAFSHFAIVESVSGNTVKTVNGNTAGEDNLGGQVQTKEHPLSDWTAFFNPLLIMQGNLGSGESSAVEEKPKTLKELLKEKYRVDKKEEESQQENGAANETAELENNIQPKTDTGSWHVDAKGKLNTNTAPSNPVVENDVQAKEEDTKKEEDKQQSPQISLQQKQMHVLNCKDMPEAADSVSCKNEHAVQSKTAFNNSSLTQQAGAERSLHGAEQNRGPPQVQLKKDNGKVQRSWLGDAWDAVSGLAGEIGDLIDEGINAAKDWLLDKLVAFVAEIPGYSLLGYILGYDPITWRPVDKTPTNLLAAVIDLIPIGGSIINSVLDYFQATTPVADWLFGAVGDFVSMIEGIGSQFEAIWNGITIDSVADPESIINQVADLFRNTVSTVFNFAVECGSTFLTMVKDVAITNVVGFVQNYFPDAFDMLCVVLGENPISKEKVDRNGTNIMNAGLKVLGEEGTQIKEQMLANGIFDKCVAWIDRAISDVTQSVEEVKEAFTSLWTTITFESLFHPIDTFNLVVEKFTSPITRIANFLKDAVLELLKILKDALLGQLSAYAKGTKGYYLITVLIQQDIFTGDHVDFNAENLIHGFMKLMDGGEEQFQQMKESGAIAEASKKITAAVKKLNFTWEYVKGLFTSLWEGLLWTDFLNILGVFAKVIDTFGEPVLRLIAFIIEIIKIVIEVLLIIMNFPFNLINNIIAKAMMAFELIKKDPIGFLKNLLRAIKEGFMQFFDNILTHLFNGLKDWFLGEVKDAGIPIPTDFTVMGIIKWLLAVLDITMEKIWKKLEERIGKPKVDKIKKMIDTAERVAGAVGEAYEFMKDVQERGFMAVMIDKVKEQLSNVWEMVLDAVKGFVMDQIIKKVTVKLLSMLDPTGIMAVINSAIALYKAIQTFIKYLREMLEIVNSFVEGTLQIAQGATKKAADFLEGALGSAIPIVIGFLANQVGLNLSERLREALEIVREKVDKGLTWVIDKLVGLVEKLVGLGKAAIEKVQGWLGFKKPFKTQDGKSHSIYTEGEGSSAKFMVASTPKTLEQLVADRKKEIEDENKANTAKVAENGPRLTALAEILKIKNDIDPNLTKYAEAVDKKSDTESNALKDTINNQMNQILEKLIIAGVDTEGSNNIETNVTHSSTSNDRPSVVTAFPLTKIPGNTAGSTPQERPVGWDFIPASSNPSSNWVGAHLLNHNLHGPGVAWNMVCGTKETNNNMKTEVENTAKKEVLNNPAKQYYFEAKVTYYAAQPAVAASPAFPEKIYFPSKIDTEFGELTGDKGNFTKGKLIASRPFSQDSPQQTKTSMPSFNESSASRLYEASVKATKTVSKDIMKLIVDARKSLPTQSFGNSVANMISVVDAYGVSNAGKTAGWLSGSGNASLLISLSLSDIFMEY